MVSLRLYLTLFIYSATMQKATLRRLIRMRKHRLTQSERAKQSQAIMRLLEDHPVFQKAHVVLLYAALSDEVQTLDFIERWHTRKQILLPVVVGDNLELRRYAGAATLAPGAYKILEPLTTQSLTAYSTIDLAVIPGVGFTLDGRRLGRGKGYYDRLLSHPDFERVYKVGLAYPCQLLPSLPHEPHDVCLHEVISLDSAISIVKK